MYIHESRYKKIQFLNGKTKSFISWICPLLKPTTFEQNQFIYMEGDDVNNIYFLIKGMAAFVLPSYENTSYIEINSGNHFGVMDIIGSVVTNSEVEFENWFIHKDIIHRQFTIMAKKQIEVLTLSIGDLNRMKLEFFETYDSLFDE